MNHLNGVTESLHWIYWISLCPMAVNDIRFGQCPVPICTNNNSEIYIQTMIQLKLKMCYGFVQRQISNLHFSWTVLIRWHFAGAAFKSWILIQAQTEKPKGNSSHCVTNWRLNMVRFLCRNVSMRNGNREIAHVQSITKRRDENQMLSIRFSHTWWPFKFLFERRWPLFCIFKCTLYATMTLNVCDACRYSNHKLAISMIYGRDETTLWNGPAFDITTTGRIHFWSGNRLENVWI